MTQRPRIDPIEKQRLYGRIIEHPRVDRDRCTACGSCVKVCPGHVLELQRGAATVVAGDACIACGHCWAVCPERAVMQRDSAASDEPDFATTPAVTTNDLELLFKQRRSVRRFTKEPIDRTALERIVNAGCLAPTGANRQNVGFVVLPERAQVDELRLLTEDFLHGLFQKLENPLIGAAFELKSGHTSRIQLRNYALKFRYLLAQGRKSPYFPLPFGSAVMLAHAPKDDATGAFNAITALHTSALYAQTAGLGSCYLGFVIVGATMDRTIRQWLAIPKGHACHSAMVLGHPAVHYYRPVGRLRPRVRWM